MVPYPIWNSFQQILATFISVAEFKRLRTIVADTLKQYLSEQPPDPSGVRVTDIYPSKPEAHLNNIFKSSSYLTEKTASRHYEDRLVNAIYGNNRCTF
jgi:hypothetical protein